MLRQQNGVVTPHLGHPSIDPALGGYPTKKGEIFFCHNSHLPKGTVIHRQNSVKTLYKLQVNNF